MTMQQSKTTLAKSHALIAEVQKSKLRDLNSSELVIETVAKAIRDSGRSADCVQEAQAAIDAYQDYIRRHT